MTDYDFRSLSPIDFEAFARELLNRALGREFETFAVGRDGGIDIKDPGDGSGPVLGQCKHQPGLTGAGLLRVLRAEIAPWKSAPPAGYVFVTSASVSPAIAQTAEAELAALTPFERPLWLQGRLNDALGQHKDVERRHFKLWLSSVQVLEQVLEGGRWQRSEALLRRVQSRIRLHVQTPATAAALKLLDDESMVVITGDPGVGKSTLAEMLLLQHWHEDWTVVNLSSWDDDSWRYTTPDHGRVILYYDDFLGQTSFAEVAKNEASGLRLLMDHIHRNPDRLRLVLTTRTQVLTQARTSADDRIRRLPIDPISVQVDLTRLDRSMKAQMLFNHLYFAGVDAPGRQSAELDLDAVLAVIDHPNFNPRLLESGILTTGIETAAARVERLTRILAAPDEVWDVSFEQLPPLAADLLMQLALLTGPIPIDDLYEALGQDSGRDWQTTLRLLDGTWISISQTLDGRSTAALFDGSRRDFLLHRLADLAMLDRVLQQSFSLTQLRFLLALADTAPKSNPELARLIRQRTPRIGRRAEAIASSAFRVAREDTQQRQAGNRRPGRNGTWKTDTSTFDRRIEEALAAVSLIEASDVSSLALLQTLREEVQQLLEAVPEDHHADPGDGLFHLAETLQSSEQDLAAGLAREGVQRALFLDQLSGFERLAPDLQQMVLEMPGARDAILEAVHNELSNLDGIDTPDGREEMLDDIDRAAERFDLTVFTDDEREELAEYRANWTRPPRTRIGAANPLEQDAESSDDAIERMFSLLASQDD